jgi:flagellin
MALTINTNISSLYAQQYLAQNNTNLQNTLLRLSSGKRINNASDDPAGLAIASSMQATIGGLNTGSQNGQSGVNLVQTAQGAMQQILNDLQTMNQLAVEAANGTNSTQDRTNLNTEYQTLLTDISSITSGIKFNGVAVLSGGTISIQTGATATDKVTVTLSNTNTGTAGLNIASTSLATSSGATAAITSLGTAISTLTTGLATLGADAVKLQAAIANNNTYSTNLSAAQSTIIDTDYAAESANMAKYTILTQSDVAMLAQANSTPSLVLKLLG